MEGNDADESERSGQRGGGRLRVNRRDVLKSVSAVGLGVSTGLAGLSAVPVERRDGVVAAADSNVIDDFEDGNLDEYQLFRETEGAVVVSNPTYSGSKALSVENKSTEMVSTTGLDYYPSAGDTFSTNIRWEGTANALALCYGVQDYDNRYYAQVSPDAQNIRLYREENGSKYQLAKQLSGVNLSEDTWYELRVEWQSDGTHTFSVYEDDGTRVAQVSAVDTTWSDGGIGYRAMEFGTGATDYFDFTATVGAVPDGGYSLQQTRSYILDDFRDGDLSEYTLFRQEEGATIVSDPTYNGSTALAVNDKSTELISTDGLDAYPSQGNTIRVWLRWDGTANSLALCYGVQDYDNRYYAQVSPDNETLRLYREENGSKYQLAKRLTGISLSQNTWYELSVAWNRDDSHVITLREGDGTQIGQISAGDRTWSSGGIGLRGMEYNTGATDYFDLLSVTQTARPSSVAFTGESGTQANYGFEASGDVGTGTDSDTTNSVSGVVTDGDTDVYDFAGEVERIEDGDARLDVDYGTGQLTVTDRSGSSPEYEVSVSGDLTAADSGNTATVNDGTASGTVSGDSDTYDFTGEVTRFRHVGAFEADVQTAFPRTLDNPYPDATVGELAIEYVEAPSSDRIAFTSSAIGDGFNTYLARGVPSADSVPDELVLLDDLALSGTADLKWPDPDRLEFWRDGLVSTQRMSTGNIQHHTPQEEKTAPEPTPDGGVN
jgi:hypothetical protein